METPVAPTTESTLPFIDPTTPALDKQPAPAPSTEPPPEASLPECMTPLLLAGLTAISGLIVLVGWFVTTSESTSNVAAKLPAVDVRVPVVTKATPIVTAAPNILDEMPPNATLPMQRRMPSGIPNASAPDLEPEELPRGKRSIAQEPHSSLKRKAAEHSSDTPNLVMPIEVVKREAAALAYTVRRLQMPDAAPKRLKLAVTPFGHDDLAHLLTKMGPGYHFTNLRNEDLLSLDTLKKHDVVFLTCAEMFAQDFQAAVPLRKFVELGGTLYASDLRGDLVQAAFPEFRVRKPIVPGVPQRLEATVVDKGLQSYLGRKAIPLSFDAPDWRPAAFDPSKVMVCLKGAYRNNLGQTLQVPLLVKFRFQKGTVIFTSFHHAKNDSEIVRKLLNYLVFSTVNARSEARVKDMMEQSKFEQRDLRPGLLDADKPVEATFQHLAGKLQVGLGFETFGSKLKLTLRSPTGQTLWHEDHAPFVMDVPKAETGAWRYTVTPIDLPYPNFPAIVAIGSVKS